MNTRALWVMCLMGSMGIAHAAADKQPDPFAGADKNACVSINFIQNWRVLDSRNVVLFAPNAKKMYLMQLGMPISDLDFSFRVAFIDTDHDGRVCGRSPDRLRAMGSLVREGSNIMALIRLDPSQIEALEAKYDVSLTDKKKQEQKPTPAQIENTSAADS